MRATVGRCDRDRGGFVLPTVLVATVVIAGLAATLSQSGFDLRQAVAVQAEVDRLRAAADAGIVRGIAAYRSRKDPFYAAFEQGRTVAWRFHDIEVTISAGPEPARLSLNGADADEVAKAIERLFGPSAFAEILVSRFLEYRRREEPIASVEALLDPCDRIGPRAVAMRQHFTALAGTLRGSAGRPIGTGVSAQRNDPIAVAIIEAEARAGEVRVAREAVVVFYAAAPFARILRQRDQPIHAETDLCAG